MKMKYCFEKYEFGERGRIFLGYETVYAEDEVSARELAQHKAGRDITLAQIFVHQESQ